MLGKLISPFTTASSLGVTIRYAGTIVGAVLAILGALGMLTPDQVQALSKQVPELLGAIGALAAILIPIYATLTKSSSDKAAAVAQAVDAEVPKNDAVVIKTPAGIPDIVIPAKASAK